MWNRNTSSKLLNTLHSAYSMDWSTSVVILEQDFPGGSDIKASVYNVGDLGSIPELGRFPAEGNGNPFQYHCLENPMDRGPWWATVPVGCKESDMTEQVTLSLYDYTVEVTNRFKGQI